MKNDNHHGCGVAAVSLVALLGFAAPATAAVQLVFDVNVNSYCSRLADSTGSAPYTCVPATATFTDVVRFDFTGGYSESYGPVLYEVYAPIQNVSAANSPWTPQLMPLAVNYPSPFQAATLNQIEFLQANGFLAAALAFGDGTLAAYGLATGTQYDIHAYARYYNVLDTNAPTEEYLPDAAAALAFLGTLVGYEFQFREVAESGVYDMECTLNPCVQTYYPGYQLHVVEGSAVLRAVGLAPEPGQVPEPTTSVLLLAGAAALATAKRRT